MVLFAYRPEYYGIEHIDISMTETIDSEGMGVVIVAKQRNGPIGSLYARFVGEVAKFEDISDVEGY